MHFLFAQSTITAAEQTTDKLLGANFLSLALFTIILMMGMFLLFVWLDGKRQAREGERQTAYDKRQDEFTKTLIGEKSPMVIAQNRVAAILERGEERNAKQTEALEALGEKTDHQTEVVKETFGAIREQIDIINLQRTDLNQYQILVSDNLHNHGVQIEANTANIALLKQAIDDIPNQIRMVLGEQTLKSEAVQLIRNMRDEIFAYIQNELAKKITGTYPAVNEDAQ